MIKIAAVFSDNMVLQRDKKVCVWGETDENKVSVALQSEDGAIITDAQVCSEDGSFMVWLPATGAGGPYRMIVTTDESEKIFENIVMGDVFLAGGQSNMEFELRNSANGEEVVAESGSENVRFYYTPKFAWVGDELVQEENNSSWELCKPENCGRWSAVAYYFAKELSEKLGVTIGIIGCNWGGTSASCWMSEEYLAKHSELASYLDEYKKATEGMAFKDYIREYEDYLVYQAEFDKKVGEYYRTATNPTWEEAISLFGESKYPGPMGPRNFTRPCGLYESMLSRVAPYTLKGCIYYQGEEDDHKPYTYKLLLETLIEQWRKDFHDLKLPFIIIQLPGYLGEGDEDTMNWPFIREAQMDAYDEVENVGITVNLELGDKRDIHPVDKTVVGKRLALQALFGIYNMISKEEAFGPMYKGCSVNEDSINVVIGNALGGLDIKDNIISNFEIAGEDKIYYPAEAELLSDDASRGLTVNSDEYVINIASDKVSKPLYVRYCWRNYSIPTVFGMNGIPLAPFRTSRADGSRAIGGRNGLAQ